MIPQLLASIFSFAGVTELYALGGMYFFNLVITSILILGLYYPVSKRRDYLFTFFLISSIVFLLCYLLDNVKLELGFALGLFAIFGILRYRTITIPIKEMTYLFIVIGLSVINALADFSESFPALLFTNIVLLLLILVIEFVVKLKTLNSQWVIYDNLELLQKGCEEELITDLCKRTGYDVMRYRVVETDFVRDMARIIVYYPGRTSLTNRVEDDDF